MHVLQLGAGVVALEGLVGVSVIEGYATLRTLDGLVPLLLVKEYTVSMLLESPVLVMPSAIDCAFTARFVYTEAVNVM